MPQGLHDKCWSRLRAGAGCGHGRVLLVNLSQSQLERMTLYLSTVFWLSPMWLDCCPALLRGQGLLAFGRWQKVQGSNFPDLHFMSGG